MIIPRREFLKMLGVAAGAAGVGGCSRVWRVPDQLVREALRGPGLESALQTVCGLCEAGCGVTVRQVDGIPVGLQGNSNHPINRGGLCPVGQAGLEILYAPGRLEGPIKRAAGGGFETTTWRAAVEEIGDRLKTLTEQGQGDRIALLMQEPGILFFDLAEEFIRSLGSSGCARLGGIDSTPYKLTQGVGEVPGFDLAETDLVLSFGLDLYEDGPAPLYAISSLIGSRATDDRASLLHVGTRLSASASKAEEFVAVDPSTHGAFALGVAHVLVREGRYDRDFVNEHTFGFEDWSDGEGHLRLGFHRFLLEHYYPERAAALCGCEPARLVSVARRFAAASRPLAIAGGEAVGGTNATRTVMAVHALNALVGAFDRDGGVTVAPSIPLTPMPSVTNGRTEAASSVFSAGPSGGAGVDPVEVLVDKITQSPDSIQVLIIVSSNPVYSHPAGDRLKQALERIPTVVAVSPFRDETAAAAHFVLPCNTYLEGWQGTTTPQTVAFSTLGIGQPVVEPLHDTWDAGDVLLAIAGQVSEQGTEPLPWSSYDEYLRFRLDGLVVSGEGSVVTGSFEESWAHFLEERGWRFLEHKIPADFWTDVTRASGWWNPVRTRGDWPRLFPTPSGRFEFWSQALEDRIRQLDHDRIPSKEEFDEAGLPHFEEPREEGSGDLTLVPFRPITSRGSFGTASPMLMEMYGYQAFAEWKTWVELAPGTAHELELEDGDEVEVESDRSSFEAVVRIQPGSSPGVAHVPLGLGHHEALGVGGGFGANPIEVLLPSHDSLAGTPCLASTRIRLKLIRRRPRGGPAPLYGGHA